MTNIKNTHAQSKQEANKEKYTGYGIPQYVSIRTCIVYTLYSA